MARQIDREAVKTRVGKGFKVGAPPVRARTDPMYENDRTVSSAAFQYTCLNTARFDRVADD